MIFNTFEYYLLFLFPAAIMFKFAARAMRPWVLIVSAGAFYIHFSLNGFGGVAGACCLTIFLWESAFSRLYRPAAWICFAGVLQSVVFLAVFKYWNYLTGLVFSLSRVNPLHWRGAFLPLGISFFTFEFIHYAVDRYRGKTEAGALSEYLAFIMFFPTMVAGPIKRYEDFLPKLRVAEANAQDLKIGITRILTGLVKKFAIADLMTAFTVHLNANDIVKANRATLLLWIFAYGVKNIFRLRRLFRHRHRLGPAVWAPGAREFRLAVLSHQHCAILAQLAHLAFELAARLRVHSAGRIASRAVSYLLEPHRHDVRERCLARRGNQLRRMGLVARHDARGASRVAHNPWRGGGIGNWRHRRRHLHVRFGKPRLGVLLHGTPDRAPVLFAVDFCMSVETLLWIKHLIDYVAGAADEPPPGAPNFVTSAVFVGIWWAALLVMITIFSGQTSKFIYIDF